MIPVEADGSGLLWIRHRRLLLDELTNKRWYRIDTIVFTPRSGESKRWQRGYDSPLLSVAPSREQQDFLSWHSYTMLRFISVFHCVYLRDWLGRVCWYINTFQCTSTYHIVQYKNVRMYLLQHSSSRYFFQISMIWKYY